MQEIKTIGVVGHTGMVGSTVYQYFKDKGQEVYGYSRSKPEEQSKVNAADAIFICVPTPYHWDGRGYDDSAIKDALSKIEKGRIVIIKSTVWIGTTEKFQEQYPELKILFNPEFLSEATCRADFDHPDRQFIGYTKQSYNDATQVLHLLPESPYDLICPAKEAELLKYINNLHGILEVIESNHYYDVCQKEGLDYSRVIKAAVASKWVGCAMGRHYRTIYHKGYRGVGGACFPKDLNSWIAYCQEKGIDAKLFQSAKAMNDELLSEQGLTEELSEKISTEKDLETVQGEKTV